jgi:hypothetical protein
VKFDNPIHRGGSKIGYSVKLKYNDISTGPMVNPSNPMMSGEENAIPTGQRLEEVCFMIHRFLAAANHS